MEIGKLIKELRIKKGMTQEELADKTEVSARTIQRIENGEVDMQLCIWVISLAGLWIYWKTNIPIPLIGGLLVGGLISIMNAIFVMNGKPYRNPFIKSGEKSIK